MKFRSWYIVLFGILVQSGFGFLLMLGADGADEWGAIIVVVLGLLVIMLTIGLGLVPLLLLVFKKTRLAGAIVSIVLGIVGVAITAGIPLGICLIVAGILALWLKR